MRRNYRQPVRTTLLTITLLLISAGLITLGLTLACGGDSSTDSGGGGNTGTTVGPDGGTVTDEGVTLAFPAGALDNNITVAVEYHGDQWDLPDSMASSHCGELGAVTLGPSGQIFSTPISMTMPINQSMTPGDTLGLFVWNDSAQGWEETQSKAVVNADGLSVTGPVSHFSSYSPANSFNLDGNFKDLEPSSVTDVIVALNTWLSHMASFRQVGHRQQYKDCCTRVTGVHYSFAYQGPVPYQTTVTQGDIDNFDHSELYMASGGAFGTDYYVSVTIHVYWTNQPPDVVYVESNLNTLDITDGAPRQATVTGRALCNSKNMTNIPFDFSLTGPGSLSAQSASSGANGTASVIYTTTDTGHVAIEGEAQTCLGLGGLQTNSDTHELEVTSCTDWHLEVRIDFTHTGENWALVDQLLILIPLTIDQSGYVSSTTGEGSQYAVMTSLNEHCDVTGSSTPDFTVYAQGNIVGQTMYITIAPVGFFADFAMTCTYDGHTSDYAVPPYTYLLPSIIAGQIFSNYPVTFEKGAFHSGSGYDTTDDENPIAYEFTIMVGCTTSK